MGKFGISFDDLNFGNLAEARRAYEDNDVPLVVFRNFLSPRKVRELRAYLDGLAPQSLRRDFNMPQTGNTSRHMTIINGEVMGRQEPIMRLYDDPKLRRTLGFITDSEIKDCDNRTEHVIVSDLHKAGDTHGMHKDDYPYALIICVDAPKSGSGGEVRYILVGGRGYWTDEFELSMKPGDAYLMRTDTTEHGVAPLRRPGDRRRILNFTYDERNNVVHPNGTADLLLTKAGLGS